MADDQPKGSEADHDEADGRNRDIDPPRPHEIAPVQATPLAPSALEQHACSS